MFITILNFVNINMRNVNHRHLKCTVKTQKTCFLTYQLSKLGNKFTLNRNLKCSPNKIYWFFELYTFVCLCGWLPSIFQVDMNAVAILTSNATPGLAFCWLLWALLVWLSFPRYFRMLLVVGWNDNALFTRINKYLKQYWGQNEQ